MFDDLDEALRRLLVRELAINNGEVDIQFHLPSRDWSGRLSRPTLNLFLYDVRENQKLRQAQPMWETERSGVSTVARRRAPVRADLSYMITAWANEPEDEHSLLSRTWLTFLRCPRLPADVLPESLRAQPLPIPLLVGQPQDLRNPADLWNVLDNEMHPAIALTATLCLDPAQVFTSPLVRSWELRVGQGVPLAGEADAFWTVGGSLQSEKPLGEVRLTLVERGLEVPVQEGGRFVLGPIRAGEYTLELRADGAKSRRFKLTVPTADLTLRV